jgi:hypothetical protein
MNESPSPQGSVRGRAAALLRDPPFLALALVMLAAFLATRIPFFWYSPRVDLSQDSQSYLDVADTMRSGHWPRFIFRTPGYPLLVWAVTSCVDRWIAVIVVQNLLSFASALFLVHAVRRLRRTLALPAALAMCGFLGSPQVLVYDISILSDSLYASLLILAAGCLVLAVARATPGRLALASALMALAILVRPAGAYFAVIYAVVLAYLLWNRAGRRRVLGFAAPFPAILLAFCAYNLATIGQFVISPFAEANLAGATALFWEPDPRLPPSVNKALEGLPESYEKVGITRADLELVRTSWDAGPLFEVYVKAYNRLVWSAGWGSGTRFGAGDYLRNRQYIREVSLNAIRRHPDLYAKYVWANMVSFFGGIGYKFDFEASMRYRTRGGPGADAGEPAGAPSGERLVRGLQHAWQAVHGALYQSVLWSWAYAALLGLSLARLLRARARDDGALLVFALALMPLGASLVVCLVETATDRYSYPTQFVCYLLVALSPLLLGPARSGLGEAPPQPLASGNQACAE